MKRLLFVNYGKFPRSREGEMLACDVTRGAAVSRSAGEAGSRIVNMASRDLETPVSEEEYNVSDYSDSDFSVVERDSKGQIQPYMHGPTYNDNVEQNMIFEVVGDVSNNSHRQAATSSRLTDLAT